MNRQLWRVVAAIVCTACVLPPAPAAPTSYEAPQGPPSLTRLVPLPRGLSELTSELELTAGARIVADVAAAAEAELLARVLRRSTGFALPVVAEAAQAGDIQL